MSKNAYYGPYPNPNLIIVPTVNFCHPPLPTESGQIADPITNNPTINCKQISPANNNIGHPLPHVSNCNQQNLQFMNAEPFFNNTSTPEFSENFQNPPLMYQNPTSTQASSSNMSQSIEELSASKYKSSNNLVDLTGLNLLKIHSASSQTKLQDFKQIDDTNINPDKKIKTSSEKELRHCSESDTCKIDNKTKEIAKNLKSMITNGEGNPENHANGKPNDNTKGHIQKFTCKIDNKTKEIAKNLKSMITNGEGNSENHANGKPNDNTKGHIQKFHRQLWKCYFEENNDKAAKEKLSRVIKSSSSKKRQESKESKHECSKSKTHLQTTSKRNSTSTNDLRNKITEGSKKYLDLERRFVAKYPKTSKTETNSRNLQDSKVSLKDREIGLCPDDVQRYKDFQRFISRCDETKYSENQQKTKSLPSKKQRIESCENTNIKRNIDVKKKKYEIKQYIKNEKNSKVSTIQTSLENDKYNTNIEKAKDQTNADKALNKSIVRGDRKLPTKLSQRLGVEGVQDLRSKLSRKRSRSDSFVHNQKLTENSLNPESFVISVKQDVEADSKKSQILAPSVDEPKAKKCKPIELIKDIKYPDSDSGDIDPPEDLSFLDDLIIHADEIVASLPRSSKFEHLLCSSFMTTTRDNIKSKLIKKINANSNKDIGEANPKKSLINNDNMESIEINKTKSYYSKNNEKTKFKEDLNNYNSLKAIEIIKEEETSLHKRLENYRKNYEEIKLINNMKVKGIRSDTEGEDINFEIGSISCTKKHEDVKNMNQDSKNDRNSQHEENTYTAMTEKKNEEIGQKEAMHLCKDKQIITISGIKTKKEPNNTADLTIKHYVEKAPKETTSLYKAKQKITTDSKYDFTGKDYEEITSKETTTPCKAKESILTNSKDEVIIIQEATDVTDLTGNDYEEIQSEFKQANIYINKTGAISGVLNKQVNTLEKHVKGNNDNSQNSKDTVETVFNNSDQNGNILKHIEPNQIHGCAKTLKENSLQKSTDAMEVSFETVFNCTNQQDIGIYKPGLLGQPLNKQIVDVLKTAQSTIEPVTIIDLLDQDKNENEKIEIEMSKVDKYIKIETETQESVNQILQETTKNNNEQNVAIQIDTSRLKVSNIQENLLQKSGIHKTPLCRSNKTFKEQVQTFEYTFNKLANKPINYLEKKTQNGSENSTKETPETVNSNLAQNNEAESETLHIFEEKIETSTNTTIVTTKHDQKADRIQSDTSNKNVEKKPISLENSELIISEESQEKRHIHWSRIEYKTDVNTSGVTKPDRNIDDTSEKSEKVTNTLVPDGRKNIDGTGSNKHEIQLSSRPWHYKLGLRMSEYLQKEYTISSVIRAGHYSTVYKCIDTKGGAYALKIVEQRLRGIFLEGVLSQLHRYRPKQDSCILYLMNAFEFQGRWCLLTEYFPKTLEQVLNENKRGFHIDQVQVLSRQLVYAVNILASAGIIHSDIKPAHILLNSAQGRLKLCGFDRCNYFNCIKITPSSGSPKYRAPEVILGFQATHRIDVWSTGLVIFEMATSKSLFNACFNNGLLYEQLCTFGSLNWTMIEQSRNRNLFFSGVNFIRRLGPKGQQKIMIHSLERNNNLRKILFESYYQYWAQDKSQWQITKETDKLETLHTLLEQMLALDPRHRLLIQFVNASEFMNHTLTSA